LSEEKPQGNEEAPDSKAAVVVFGDVLHKGHESQSHQNSAASRHRLRIIQKTLHPVRRLRVIPQVIAPSHDAGADSRFIPPQKHARVTGRAAQRMIAWKAK